MFYDGCRNFINSLFEQQYVTDTDDTAKLSDCSMSTAKTPSCCHWL